MATITLSTGGFELIPEGVTVFRIDNVDYKDKFGKMDIRMVTESGQVHNNRYSLLDPKTKQPAQGALKAFSFFAKCAMNDFNMTEVDPVQMIGRFVKATVVHEEYPSTKEPGKMVKFIKLSDLEPVAGFGAEEEVEESEETEEVDLASLLG